MERRAEAGMTLIELAIGFAIIAIVAAIAVPAMDGLFTDQRAKAAARDVADAFALARAEAIRTGDTHLVVFQGAIGATEPIVIVNDGPAGSENCTIDAGEVVHSTAGEADVFWGTSTGGANGAVAPDDPGSAPAQVAAGSTFTDATLNPANAASWVMFQPDGMPRLFTQTGGGACAAIGRVGQGGGAMYVNNGRRDYAIVLAHLGTARIHLWNRSAGAWNE